MSSSHKMNTNMANTQGKLTGGKTMARQIPDRAATATLCQNLNLLMN
jgi:hypothetical protein